MPDKARQAARAGVTEARAGALPTLEGIIDLAIRGENRWLLVDWKTNRVAPEAVPQLRDSYRPQIAAYAKAVNAITALPVEAAVYSTPTGALIYFTDDELNEEWLRTRQLIK